METVVKVYAINKAIELAKTTIYRMEIIKAGQSGLEKFEAAVNEFWDRAEEYIKKEKEIDRKWIPDALENLGEEAIHSVIKMLREEYDPRKLLQEIFNVEKTANPNVL